MKIKLSPSGRYQERYRGRKRPYGPVNWTYPSGSYSFNKGVEMVWAENTEMDIIQTEIRPIEQKEKDKMSEKTTFSEGMLQYIEHQRTWLKNSKIKPGDKCVVIESFTKGQGNFDVDEPTDATNAMVGKTVTVIDPGYKAGGKNRFLGVVVEGPAEDGKDPIPAVFPFFCLIKADDEA